MATISGGVSAHLGDSVVPLEGPRVTCRAGSIRQASGLPTTPPHYCFPSSHIPAPAQDTPSPPRTKSLSQDVPGTVVATAQRRQRTRHVVFYNGL